MRCFYLTHYLILAKHCFAKMTSVVPKTYISVIFCRMNPEQLHNIRHTLAHLLAASVLKKYPGAKLGIGPVIENGFYYDIAFPEGASVADDLKEFEKSMKHMVKQNLPMTGVEVGGTEAKKIFAHQPYKCELID